MTESEKREIGNAPNYAEASKRGKTVIASLLLSCFPIFAFPLSAFSSRFRFPAFPLSAFLMT
jgi:hypothetical protein